MKLKNTFNKVVDVYDKARPGYPKELLRDVQIFAGKDSFGIGLEVGAGTGQATDLFRDIVERLDIVEVGNQQIEFLKLKYNDKKTSIYQSYFEEYQSENKYDLIFSATAFHWVDAEIGYPKAWNMLKPGGVMAAFWHMSSVTYHSDGIFLGLNQIKKKYLPDESLGFDEAGIEEVRKRRILQIQSGNCFSVPEIKEYRWVDIYDAERYTLLLESYSSTQMLDTEKREAYLSEVKKYIEDNGGRVEMSQHVMLYLVKKDM